MKDSKEFASSNKEKYKTEEKQDISIENIIDVFNELNNLKCILKEKDDEIEKVNEYINDRSLRGSEHNILEEELNRLKRVLKEKDEEIGQLRSDYIDNDGRVDLDKFGIIEEIKNAKETLKGRKEAIMRLYEDKLINPKVKEEREIDKS